jgi:hypothetical protein
MTGSAPHRRSLAKVKAVEQRAQAIELAGSHDLAGDNPDGLAKAISRFLAGAGL